MTTIISETGEHAAVLDGERVAVYVKCREGTLMPIGVGRWERGTILGSGVNCGVLVRLEQGLRSQTGTP